MAKLENSLKNMFLSLTVITVVVGALLGAVAMVTAEPIAQATAAAQTQAIKAVAPEFDTVGEATTATSTNGEAATIFPVMKGGQEVGKAVQAITKNGFGGKVTVMIGFDAQNNISGYAVLNHAETPGLGSKMPDWFQKDGKGNVIGKNPGTNNLTVSKDGGEVDAITAATISSRAFLDAVAQAYSVVAGVEAVTAATQQVAAPAAEEECCGGEGEDGECQKPDSEKCAKCKAAAAAKEAEEAAVASNGN